MSSIPAATLKAILELRSENGLDATEEAVYADLAKSKAKWVLEDTPRYRRAGRSPLLISGKYLSSYGTDPATGEADAGNGKKSKTASAPKASGAPVAGKVDETVFYKVLHGKGFGIKMSQNLLTGELETKIPASIEKLDLQFGKIPGNAAGVFVTQTSPQIQVAMTLDKFLELAGIKP